ncbi:sensor histidine kinase [Streptomyces sp. NPDC014622]|uniref:sensor histidine kinase n=1 Tax=Streptomyces sp. NPDC014622 TaxID=3364874 RepID=UPI0036F9ED8C
MHNQSAARFRSGGTIKLPTPRVLLFGSAAALLLFALLVDVDRLHGLSPGGAGLGPGGIDGALFLGSGAIAAALVVWALRPGTSPGATAAAATGSLVASLAASAGCRLLSTGHQPIGVTEAAATALIVPVVAYRCRSWLVAGVSVLTFVAMLASSQRAGHPLDPDNALLVLALLSPGFALRWRDERRAWHIERALRQERNALARDLHDVVAHQVTGIVVQAQALQHLATRDPDTLSTALADIEDAGVNALTAMRRLVSALRDGEHPSAETDPPTAALLALERPAVGDRPAVSVVLDAGVDLDRAPGEIAAAVVRMAQESVTNAQRHACGVGRVTVRVSTDEGSIRLDVRDDGQVAHQAHAGEEYGLIGNTGIRTGTGTGTRTTRTSTGSGHGPAGTRTGTGGGYGSIGTRGGGYGLMGSGGGGYGLIGMAERAKLLAGTFHAGPAPDGSGWQVSAALPTGAEARRKR